MKKIKFQYILCLTLLFVAGATFAQDDLESGSVEVIRSFDARLLDSEKINLNPSLPNVDTTTKRLRYDVPMRILDIKYPPPRIRPLALGGDRLPPAYNGYLKGGGGFPNAFYGEAAYHVFAAERFDVGLNLDHRSANNSRNLENQRFSYTEAQAEGTYYFDQGFAVRGNLGYTLDKIHYYGYNAEREAGDTMQIAKEEVDQLFSIFDVGVELFNGTRTVGDLNYSASFDLYFMGDDSPTNETGFDLKIMGEKWFKEKFPFRLTLETDFTRYATSSDSIQRLNNFFLKPNFTYSNDFFKAKLGANVASSDDVFSFFPDLELSANVIGSVLTIFAGAEGGLYKNNFRSLTDYNPFLQSSVRIQNTRYNRYYVGAKGNIQGITYQGEFNYKGTEDLALFQARRSNGTTIIESSPEGAELYKFRALYDDVNILNVKGSVELDIAEFKVSGTVNYNIYNMTNEEKPWHLPALEVNAGVQYTTLEDKLQVKGELFIQNGVPFINNDNIADNLNGLLDINLSAEYFFSDNFGGFINLYNIANNKRERWFRYPTYGLNALAGITLRF
ncbi:MAG: hypothetical protein AAFP82_00255 [Bacteroidota bacterium]